MNFAKYRPCVYEKDILCSECTKQNGCDMKAGRELHQKCYEEGYVQGWSDHITKPPSKTYNYSCECGWLHLEVWDGFKCGECGRTFKAKDETL